MKYKVYVHYEFEPKLVAECEFLTLAEQILLDEFRNRLQKVTRVLPRFPDNDYMLYEIIADDQQYDAAIEWEAL